MGAGRYIRVGLALIRISGVRELDWVTPSRPDDDDGYDDCFAAMSISESGIDKQQNHTNENSQVFLGTLSSPVDLCSPTRGLDGWMNE